MVAMVGDSLVGVDGLLPCGVDPRDEMVVSRLCKRLRELQAENKRLLAISKGNLPFAVSAKLAKARASLVDEKRRHEIIESKLRLACADAAQKWSMLADLPAYNIGRDIAAKLMNHSACLTAEDVGCVCAFFEKQMPPLPVVTIQEVRRGKLVDEWSRPGNYFAWEGDRVVYVGASRNMWKRISTTKHPGLKKDDLISVLPCSELQVFISEHFYLWLLVPERNNFRTP